MSELEQAKNILEILFPKATASQKLAEKRADNSMKKLALLMKAKKGWLTISEFLSKEFSMTNSRNTKAYYQLIANRLNQILTALLIITEDKEEFDHLILRLAESIEES